MRLRIVANGVNKLKSDKNAIIVITHYQRLLDYIVPDFVHVLYNGRIVKSGGKELALELEEKGYDWIKQEKLNYVCSLQFCSFKFNYIYNLELITTKQKCNNNSI